MVVILFVNKCVEIEKKATFRTYFASKWRDRSVSYCNNIIPGDGQRVVAAGREYTWLRRPRK